MTKEDIRSTLNAAPEGCIITVTIDNEHFFSTGLKGQVLTFDDSKEKLTVVMSNADPRTMIKYPFAIYVTEYEHIQSITLRLQPQDVMTAATTLGVTDTEALNKFFTETHIADAYMPASSIEDVDERVGRTPSVYRTDEYMNAGEDRKTRRIQTPYNKPIKVNSDGTVPEKTD